jgi:DNA sulfur modification protein DndC|tara:strand:+ start:243 stop:830 length:588 start_codon:yes stop_codon:yes gene_type:complete
MAFDDATARSGLIATQNRWEYETTDYLRTLYYRDTRPWVVAFSGGKDSTAVLDLVYSLVLELGEKATKPIYIVSSDTLVEAPNIILYLEDVLAAINRHAQKNNLPISAEIVRPLPSESFWTKLIGLGYPPPTRWFRWCTANMKIKPSRRAIDRITANYGSAILLLGTRLDESDDRRKRMEARNSNLSNVSALGTH